MAWDPMHPYTWNPPDPAAAPAGDDWFAAQGAPTGGGGVDYGNVTFRDLPGGAGAPGGGGADIPTTTREGDWEVRSGGFSGAMTRRNVRTGETQSYNRQTGQWVSGPYLQGPPAPGGGPAPSGGGGQYGDPQEFGRLWLASGGRTVADLQAFVAAHPEYGAVLRGSKGEHIVFPNGEAYDGVLAAGAGGRGASFNKFTDGGGGGGGGRIGEGLENTPGYQFRLSEGLKALERSAAARGTLLSGGTLKGMQRYAQDVASTEYGNRVNQLMDLSRLGLAGASGSANIGSQYAGQAGSLLSDQAQQLTNLTTGQGNAQAAGTIAGGNALTNAIGQGSNSILQMYLLSKLFGSGSGAGGTGVS